MDPLLIIIIDQYVSCLIDVISKILENALVKQSPSILTSHFVFDNNNQMHQKLLFKFLITL